MVDYGLAANLVAVPLTSLWIMPAGLLGYALMPVGLEHLALVPMGWGIAVVDRGGGSRCPLAGCGQRDPGDAGGAPW